jgi:hypothetical protein
MSDLTSKERKEYLAWLKKEVPNYDQMATWEKKLVYGANKLHYNIALISSMLEAVK